jgi:hypothetical protein
MMLAQLSFALAADRACVVRAIRSRAGAEA